MGCGASVATHSQQRINTPPLSTPHKTNEQHKAAADFRGTSSCNNKTTQEDNDAFEKTWQSVKRLFVSRDTEEAVKQICQLLMKLHDDQTHAGEAGNPQQQPLTPLDIMMGLVLMDSVDYRQTISTTMTHTKVVDSDMLSKAHLAMCHAASAYGWKMLSGLLTTSIENSELVPLSQVTDELARVDPDAADVEALCKLTGVMKTDLVDAVWSSRAFSPAHYIVLDKTVLCAVVLSLRGSWGLHDGVTDLLAKDKPLSFDGVDGYVHEGVWLCSVKKVEEIEHILVKVVPQLNNHLIITGHSLGGGAATLVAIILAEKHPDWKIDVWAMCPAATMTKELSQSKRVREMVCSFVFRDDIVPRLSFGSLELLLLTIKAVVHRTSLTQKLFTVINAGNLMGDQLSKVMMEKFDVTSKLDFEKASQCGMKELTDLQQRQSEDKKCRFMFPAGHLFYIDGTPSAQTVVYEINEPGFFNRIPVTENSIQDHFPWRALRAVQSVIKTMQ